MMMSIALRFIPTLIEETDKIMSAQKARGADFEYRQPYPDGPRPWCRCWCRCSSPPSAGPMSWPRPWSAAATTAARAARRLHVLRYERADWLVLGGFIVLAAGIIVLGRFGL